MQRAHWLDHVVALTTFPPPLFHDGWGDPVILNSVEQNTAFNRAPTVAPAEVRWNAPQPGPLPGTAQLDGTFPSPHEELPSIAHTVHVRWIRPAHERSPEKLPVCVVLASSRDEGYELRTRLCAPLAQEGLSVVLLENPFYGLRKPHKQPAANLRTVSDHLLMNIATVEESIALLGYFRSRGHLTGIAGFSMGGAMATIVAALYPHEVAISAFAAGEQPSSVFLGGLLTRTVDLHTLSTLDGNYDRAVERLARLFDRARASVLPAPQRPDAAFLVGASRDGYVQNQQVIALHKLWPGSTLRWEDTGHAALVLFRGPALRRAIHDSFAVFRYPTKPKTATAVIHSAPLP